jgi:hypothetical protein
MLSRITRVDNISKIYTLHLCFENGPTKSTQIKVGKHSMHLVSMQFARFEFS